MARVGERFDMKATWALHWWTIKKWWELEPKLLISVVLNSSLSAVIPFITVWFSARIIDELAGDKNPERLFFWVTATVLVTAALSAISSCLNRWKEQVHAAEEFIENRMFNEKFLGMDFSSTEAASTKDILVQLKHHCMGNVYGFQNVQHWYFQSVVKGMTGIVSAVVLLFGFFTQKVPEGASTLLWLNHPLTNLFLIVLLVGGVFFTTYMNGRVSATHAEKLFPLNNLYNRYCNSMGTLGWKTENQLDVRMYNQQEVAWNAMERHDHCKKGSQGEKIFRQMGMVKSLGEMSDKILICMVYLFVGLKARAGAFGIGSATQYIGAITAVCGGIVEIFYVLSDMPNNAAFLDSIRNFMEIPEEMYKGSLTTEKRADRNYEVEFQNVSFQYPGTETWALRNVSVKFRIGSHLAIVGENGSGKTTFIKLLCRLYDPQEGRILLNGIDIHKYNCEDYRKVFSVVFQDFKLLAGTLGSNVAGSVRYDEERVHKALSDAGFTERLATMPKGLDTELYRNFDPEGVIPSGGESQKIAIARALYKDAPFIILDEPTAALDPMAEAEIYAQFHKIAGNKTSIYISHRLSSCRFCEEILVFDKGSIIERGSHEELVEQKNSKYYTLWNAQAKYYSA